MFFVIKKRILILFVTVLVILVSVPITTFAVKNSSKPTGLVMIIDAGHGGVDLGVIGKTTGVRESDLTLEIAKLIEGYAKSANYSPIMTRKNANGLYGLKTPGFKRRDMNKRAKIIKENNPVVVVSIHMNFYPESYRRGIQVFYSKSKDKDLALNVQDYLNKNMNITYAGRNFSSLKGDFFLLNESPCEAIIVECGFLSNPEDEKLLLDAEYRMLLAYNIFSAINLYLETSLPSS